MTEKREYFGYGFSPDGREAAWEEVETDLPAKGEGCPLTADLMELALGRASAENGQKLMKHLEQCAYCRRCFETYQRHAESLGSTKSLALEDSMLGEFLADPEPVGLADADQQSEGSLEPGEPSRPFEALRAGVVRAGSGREENASPHDRSLARQASTPTQVMAYDGISRATLRRMRKHWAILSSAPIIFVLGLVCVISVRAAYADDARIKAQEQAIKDLQDQDRHREAKLREQEKRLLSTLATLGRLEQEIKTVGLASVVTLRDLKAFTVVEPGRNRLRFAGTYNPLFIKEVRFRWGVEPEGTFITLDNADQIRDPMSGCVRFENVSPELPLKNESATAVLEFVPDPEMAKRFPEYFTVDRLEFRRNFYLSRNGIEADIELAVITAPRDGATVERTQDVEGQLKKEGWPVVCIKALDDGGPWHVQPPIERLDDDGRFNVRAYFGNQGTPPGMQFRVVILIAPNKQEAEKYRVDRPLLSLPVNLPRSKVLTVVRQ